jgi:hypothetical protein
MDVAKVTPPEADDARDWLERQPVFWAIVVAPWVLIQEIKEPL